MIQVVIVGSGNVAFHLHRAFLKAHGVALVQLYGRTSASFSDFDQSVPKACTLSELAQADLYIIAVSDDAIQGVFEQIRSLKGLIVHTSGSFNFESKTDGNRTGVFYPLQTFSKTRELNFAGIPILVEAAHPEDLGFLRTIAKSIGALPENSTADARNAVHLAAVFANNFTNHLFFLASDICAKHGLNSKLLYPLIQETVAKLEILSPKDAQTGPARRGDRTTQIRHVELLASGIHQELYKLIAHSIQKTYEKEL